MASHRTLCRMAMKLRMNVCNNPMYCTCTVGEHLLEPCVVPCCVSLVHVDLFYVDGVCMYYVCMYVKSHSRTRDLPLPGGSTAWVPIGGRSGRYMSYCTYVCMYVGCNEGTGKIAVMVLFGYLLGLFSLYRTCCISSSVSR